MCSQSNKTSLWHGVPTHVEACLLLLYVAIHVDRSEGRPGRLGNALQEHAEHNDCQGSLGIGPWDDQERDCTKAVSWGHNRFVFFWNFSCVFNMEQAKQPPFCLLLFVWRVKLVVGWRRCCFFQKTGGGSGGGDDDDDKMNTLNLIMVFIIRNGEVDSDEDQYNDVMKETISSICLSSYVSYITGQTHHSP